MKQNGSPTGQTARRCAACGAPYQPGHSLRCRRRAELLCDFCSRGQVVQAFDAADVELAGRLLWGEWTACADCGELIDAGDLEGLAARAAALYLSHAPAVPWRRALRLTQEVVAAFARARQCRRSGRASE